MRGVWKAGCGYAGRPVEAGAVIPGRLKGAAAVAWLLHAVGLIHDWTSIRRWRLVVANLEDSFSGSCSWIVIYNATNGYT